MADPKIPTPQTNACSDDTIRLDAPHSTRTSVMPMKGSVLKARGTYRLGQCLGRGGFGAVFEATTISRGEGIPVSSPDMVAIKIYQNPRREEFVRDVKRELSALLALSHPRIPAVYDWAISSERAFLVMRHFAGGSLRDRLRNSGQLDEPGAWRLLEDLLSALNAAHSASVLHLDIKPANVLLDDDGGFALTDFGISQGSLVSWKLVAPGLGTLGYRSPEQAGLYEEYVGVRTDLFGVGATVWAMITGEDLSEHREHFIGDQKGATHAYPSIWKFRKDASEELESLLSDLLTLSPDDRPGGAAEALARVQRRQNRAATYSASTIGTGLSLLETEALSDRMFDPLWAAVVQHPAFSNRLVRLPEGAVLVHQGDYSYLTFILLEGALEVTVDDRLVGSETREGTFIGEIATLTGRQRTATVRTKTPAILAVLNAAELENLVTGMPAVGIRLMRELATRLEREREYHRKS